MNHLSGRKLDGTDVIGVYPLLPDNTCYFLVFDFDNHEAAEGGKDNGWQEEADALRRACLSCGVSCLVERSRSGEGAHVWIFFSEAIPAWKARRFGRALLHKGAESVNFKDFKSYDRMIPMQDYLKDGGLGNLISLPLQGQALLHGNSAFVDEDWNVYRNQWKALAETKKLSLQEVEQKLQEWGGQDEEGVREGDSLSKRPGERKESAFQKEDATGPVFITLADGIYIEKQNLMPRMQNQIRRLAAYENPEFYKKFAMGYSTYDTPRIVYRGRDEDGYIHLPRGCLQELIGRLKEGGVAYHLEDKRNTGRDIHVCFTGSLYPEQQAGVEEMLKYHTGILQAATAFGKTVVGAYLIAVKKKNTLILVQNTEIMKNWQEDLSKFLSFQEELPTYVTPSGRVKRRKSVIGTLQGGRDALTGIVDIAMMGSLRNPDKREVLRKYGLVIMDECHHAGAETDEAILSRINADTVYGLTATPKRSDGQEPRVRMQFGPVRYRYTAKDRAQKQGIGHYVYPRFTHLRYVGTKKAAMPELYRLVVDSKERNELIVQDVLRVLKQGRTPLVMTKYKEHAALLYDKLQGKADHVLLLEGGRGRRQKERIREEIRQIPSDESVVLVGIGKYIGEGFNYPRLDTLFLAMPISWEGNVEQYAGRLNRDYDGKKEVIIFDYIDAHIPTLERMYHKRMKTYKQIGFEIRTDVQETSASSNVIFDCSNYRNIFEKDLVAAQKEIIISSPGISKRKAEQYAEVLGKMTDKEVHVVILTLPVGKYGEAYRRRAADNLTVLKNEGIEVLEQPYCREHFAVIDRRICWYGSMNLLSNEKEEDNLIRLEDSEVAEELLELGSTDQTETSLFV